MAPVAAGPPPRRGDAARGRPASVQGQDLRHAGAFTRATGVTGKHNAYHVLYTPDGTPIQSFRGGAGQAPVPLGQEVQRKKAPRPRTADGSDSDDAAPPPKRARKPRAKPPPPDPWAPPAPAEIRARLGLPEVDPAQAAEAQRLFERLGACTEVTRELGDARQSDAAGRGTLFTKALKKSTMLKDPGVAQKSGNGYQSLDAYDYVHMGGTSYTVLRDEEARVATHTFYVNEARDDKQPTVAWRALRGRQASCGSSVLWAWELVRDVEPGDEVLTTYEEDNRGVAATRPDARSGVADALAATRGVPRRLQGCGPLHQEASRRANTVDRAAGVEDRELLIAVENSLKDAKLARLRAGDCACHDLETGKPGVATSSGGAAWYTITFGDGTTASRRADQLEPLEETSADEPAAAPAPAAAPPTPPPPALVAAPPYSSQSSDEAIALALQSEDAAPTTPAPAPAVEEAAPLPASAAMAAEPTEAVEKAPAAAAPSTPVAEAPPAPLPIAATAEPVAMDAEPLTAPVAMELEPAAPTPMDAEPAEAAPELAALKDLYGPLGEWYAASILRARHGAYPETLATLASWPALGEVMENFLMEVSPCV